MISNIADTLSMVAAEHGPKTGIIEARTGRSLSFLELDLRSRRYASYLANNGIGQGQRVMLMVKPSADFICLTFALFRLGAPVILIDPGMGYRNVLRCIETVRPDHLIGIPAAVFFSRLFRQPFRTVRRRFSVGSLLNREAGGIITAASRHGSTDFPAFLPDERSLAAIIFTTGSTGPPKGVRFEHTIFSAQLRHIRSYYRIGPDDRDQPGFPLFALFSTALGATAVIPDMDPSRPAQVNPEVFVDSINRYQVTYSFGSPAIWNAVSRYCLQHGRSCPSLRKVLMAGAPVSGELIERVYRMLGDHAEVHTPYGATESLPIVSMEGREILEQTWKQTQNGAGACVGRPLPGISLKIIAPADQPFTGLSQCTELPRNQIGEIIVRGDVVTRAYDHNEAETIYSKIPDEAGFWHRMGDVGYLDDQSRLWFCGRKAHRVHAAASILHTIPCEAIINTHPDVFRSALVGIDASAGEIPALVIELEKGCRRDPEEVLGEIRTLAQAHPLTTSIRHFFIHPGFPVDIRHNAKIFREKLKVWVNNRAGGQP